MAPGGSKKPPQDILGETIPRENPRLTFEETSSLLLPEKERRYHSSQKQMKTKYYELEARCEQICNEVQKNLSSTLSCELEVMSSTLISWRKVLSAHKREHYAQCLQLMAYYATEFNVFTTAHLKSHYRLDECPRSIIQCNFREAYLCSHIGSKALDMLSKPL